MNLSKETKTAIFAIAGFALFFIGFNYLKSNDVFVRDNIFYAVYDNAEGLVPGTAVTIQGFQVGTIDEVSLLSDNQRIVVRFRVLQRVLCDYTILRFNFSDEKYI